MPSGTRRVEHRNKAIAQLNNLFTNPQNVIVIHYSCESFYDRPDGSSPRTTSIAVANLETRQANSFSIHQVAETKGYSAHSISTHYDELEKIMLDKFYEFVRTHQSFTWLHWNMRNIQYGFHSIEHRYEVLGGSPVTIDDSKLVDLAGLLHDMYGGHYIAHPRLKSLVERNNLTNLDFLDGKAEADAFINGEYVKLHNSTLRKVDIISTIAQKADSRTLLTDASLRDIYGSHPIAFTYWLSQNWVVQLLLFIFALLGVFASAIQILQWLQPAK